LQLRDTETGEIWLDRSGQWVEYRRVLPWAFFRTVRALEGTTLQNPQEVEDILGYVITGWNWDGVDGKPLPTPAEDSGIFDILEAGEVDWLYWHIPGVNPVPKGS